MFIFFNRKFFTCIYLFLLYICIFRKLCVYIYNIKLKTMKKTTENKPNIRLLPEETIELLKATLEEPPVSRIEELLYCAYIDEDLRQISPGQIVWGENPEDEGEKKDKVYRQGLHALRDKRRREQAYRLAGEGKRKRKALVAPGAVNHLPPGRS